MQPLCILNEQFKVSDEIPKATGNLSTSNWPKIIPPSPPHSTAPHAFFSTRMEPPDFWQFASAFPPWLTTKCNFKSWEWQNFYLNPFILDASSSGRLNKTKTTENPVVDSDTLRLDCLNLLWLYLRIPSKSRCFTLHRWFQCFCFNVSPGEHPRV